LIVRALDPVAKHRPAVSFSPCPHDGFGRVAVGFHALPVFAAQAFSDLLPIAPFNRADPFCGHV
jgi:hypothetical protein